MADSRVVIGVDPGLAVTGYGVIREHPDGSLEYLAHGVITTTRKQDDPHRLLALYRELKEVVKQHRPDSCAVEKLFMRRNVKTAIRVGEGRGAALIALASADLPLQEYAPSEIKQAVVGYGNADKLQVQEMVKLLLNMQDLPRPDDAADALAVAICHIHTSGRRMLTEEG